MLVEEPGRFKSINVLLNGLYVLVHAPSCTSGLMLGLTGSQKRSGLERSGKPRSFWLPVQPFIGRCALKHTVEHNIIHNV